MTYVVIDKCVHCKYTDCVSVCPVNCFYEGKNMLAINPDECIDCGACVPECPVNAIFSEDDLPKNKIQFKEHNREFSQKRGWPNISVKKPALPEAEQWKDVEDKEKEVSSEPGP